ncbi:acyl carrier protein [Saccharobesus litoralis]|uniref:Acyl carrier protein n=1 Tax=Saccharobesus litoralis TaxID=2172099 RepID=A0A2S0VNF2_9ALTE|nr:acyl carrier protein [Saccharobesus litoralis]AWB65699.1 acyl carrier protein [Saccharobesus litoralis]
MSQVRQTIINTVFAAINECKKTAFDESNVDLDFYLGGDLGIDSREMLEIWYDIEKKLEVEVHDYEKRDIYTLENVIDVFAKKMAEATA